MKLTIDARMYLSSGIGVYLQNLLPRLGNIFPPESMTLLVSKLAASQVSASVPSADIRALHSSIYTISEQLELATRARRNRLWWSPHFNIPLAYKGRLVVTIHDLYHLMSPEIARNPLKMAYARTMLRSVLRRASKIICVSNFTAAEFERLVGSRAGQIEVVHNGLDESWLKPVSGPRMHGVPYFLFVGNLKPNKNVQGLVRAYLNIWDQLPHDLVIVGQKSGFITGDRQAGRLARAGGARVKFTGFVSSDDLRRWDRDAAALVFPSFYEGFGFPPLEAMALQCPVAASNAASCRRFAVPLRCIMIHTILRPSVAQWCEL